jgi:hypothetical protein
LTSGERADPTGTGAKYRVQLLNQLLVLGGNLSETRSRTVTNATKYLSAASAGILEVARRDLAEYDVWKSAVATGKSDFEERYRKEFLSGEQFRRIDRYREEMMSLLELPGAGRVLGGLIWLLRTPYRLTREYVTGLVARPEVYTLSEAAVLNAALTGWLDRLQAEGLRRAPQHPFWKNIAARFDAELAPEARDLFELERRGFELKETDELERSGKALVERLEKNPLLLNTLRIGKVCVDLFVIAAIIYLTWIPSWYHFLLLFVAVSLTHQITEFIVRAVVESARSRVRHQREALVTSLVTAPLAAWLAEWPARGGSSIERMLQVLRRVPEAIRRLEMRLAAKVAGEPASRLTPTPPPLPLPALTRTPEPS